MRSSDLIRYALLGGIIATADANRREYHMVTTWLPHLLTNTFTLLLPDLYRATIPEAAGSPKRGSTPTEQIWQAARQTLDYMVRDNPTYTVYVAPLAVGYILSHPRFNIYKGPMGDIRLAGFGLDAIPHAATGLALTALICDTLDTAATTVPKNNLVADTIHEADQQLPLFTMLILFLVTSWWEVGEYLMHRHELALRGDISKINMQWSVEDTGRDVISNLVGWALALIARRYSPNKRK